MVPSLADLYPAPAIGMVAGAGGIVAARQHGLPRLVGGGSGVAVMPMMFHAPIMYHENKACNPSEMCISCLHT